MSDDLKREVGRAAAQLVEDGMLLGIGTGSTAEAFIDALAERVKEGLRFRGVPTSERTQAYCAARGIETITLEDEPELDLTIDGADEVDPQLNLIKGAGGALLREKIVAHASSRMVVIADDSKLVETLGAFPLPIEVNAFGLKATRIAIAQAAADCDLEGGLNLREKGGGEAYITDGGHLILDASFGRIVDPEALARALESVPGVVQHGLFTAMASSVIVAGEAGVRTIEPTVSR